MSSYIKSLISTMAISSLVLYLAPEFSGQLNKYLKYVCGLVMLLSLIMPFTKCCHDTEEIKSRIYSFFESADNPEEEQTRHALIEGTAVETAYAIMSYLDTEHNISSDRISVTVFVSEDDEPKVEEVQIFLHACEPSVRALIRQELEKMTSFRVFVFEKQ